MMTPLARSLLLTAALLLGLYFGLTDAFLPHGLPANGRPASSKANPTAGPPAATTLQAVNTVDPAPVNSDKPSWLPKIPNGCDSDYECEGTEVCCDFMFFKTCCSDGTPKF